MTTSVVPPSRDRALLRQAVALAEKCPRSAGAFAVGALVADAAGEIIATGYSRETDSHDHAEEVALARVAPDDPRLATATIYSSLEPCSTRSSRPRSCTRLILDTPIPRVVFAWREPAIFVDCEGAEQLRAAGREVVELAEFADLARRPNTHLFGG
ncbi:pyrimidine deaminase RibD-like protein [Actinoalloteichus hoggarensis]|uniref:Bifunctional diaminohydroxyphosphoribosylaminopyrimidine deaminase/5-amino-6-(5-phosphoribosylamino)uracil reductase n=1 Tax=Actinoalloteichus hoggarensis TaxID=1470176 RepID=A0A221W370_9PSEU|nr:deaminase [Actinoalloteichus hoggarensis]ASO20280.1 bifunctional diaminohydroxyphosphoribosylaminopyrimidine deaminase/5-amino-6-(5-phosphoribosylamino)uracil reductase [Actinoalloteichus hoggarensis]MBB5919006.1 pyrimidine deaminase RibD-like protein [Actinoalloteichus hoggarensis]